MRPNTSTSILYISLFLSAWFLLEYILVRSLALAYIPLFTGGFLLWWFTTSPHYVGGVWTAILPITLGWYTFFAIRREINKERAVQIHD